jgi:hypothetical protein
MQQQQARWSAGAFQTDLNQERLSTVAQGMQAWRMPTKPAASDTVVQHLQLCLGKLLPLLGQ